MSGQKKSGASGRPKGHIPSGDLFALGSKSSRQSSSPSPLPPSKKPHLEDPDDASGSSGPTGSGNTAGSMLFSDPIKIGAGKMGGDTSSTSSTTSKLTTTNLPQSIEVRPVDLVSAVEESLDKNPAKVEKLLAGAFKQLRTARLKLDVKLNEALKTLLLKHPKIFSTPSCIENILTVLKRESAAIFKTRSEPLTYTLACNIILISLQESYEWPESIAKAYIEDALGDRVWADLPGCQLFTANVCTVFNTLNKPSDESAVHDSADILHPILSQIEVQPRFSLNVCRVVHTHVMSQIRDILGKRGIQQPSELMLRNHVKFLSSACGISEVRLFITEKFDQWILNTKMVKPVQDLLYQVAYNCNQHTVDDIKTLENVVSAKLKTRIFTQPYVLCIKEFISSHSENLETIVKRLVTNELAQSTRSPSNMQLLTMTINEGKDRTAAILSVMFQEFLLRKEDYHRALRGFLRELVRQVRSENFPFVAFARGLMQEIDFVDVNKLEQGMKDRLTYSLTDLICQACFLSASLLMREAHSAYTKGEKTMVPELRNFFETVSMIQRDAVWWIHSIVPNALRPQPADYKSILRKVLFLEGVDVYCNKDNWPGEAERGIILQLMTEAGLHGDTLMRLLVIGLMRELPLQPSDALDMADKLVARAANAHTSDIPRVPILDRKELFNAIFDITAYCPPSSIVLPKGYTPPKLAISKLYWKGWILLLVLSAFNPTTVGAIGWKDYPTLKLMMEMVMTQNYVPPPDPVHMDDVKDEILTYENHLASSSSNTKVTEGNSYLLNHVTLLDPTGPPRKMASSVIELVKTVNTSLHLGQLLCQCRNPDFLLDVINHQGTHKAMNWLKELVEGSQSSFDVLPISCLCEFLIMGYQERSGGGDSAITEDTGSAHRVQFKRKHRGKEKLLQQQELIITRLRSLVSGTSPSACLEVLKYFLAKLSSSQLSMRQMSLKALQELMNAGNWLLEGVPVLPTFNEILSDLVMLVLDACAVETDPALLVNYISFLSHHLPDDHLISMVTLLSSILCKRFQFLRNILTDSSALLGRFATAFDMFLKGTATPPTHLEVEDLRRLCLQGSDGSASETVIQWDFLNSLWLLLSLSAQYTTPDEYHLVELLCPESNPIKVLSMANGESQTVLSDRTLKYLLSGSNSALVDSIVSLVTTQSLVYYVCSHGVTIANTDIMIKELIKRGVTPNEELMEYVKGHHLRGCTSARRLLESWGVASEELRRSLREMLTIPKPRRRHPSLCLPDHQPLLTVPDFSKVFLEPSVTSDIIMYLLINFDKMETISEGVAYILQVLRSPMDRKNLMKHMELNEFSCLLLSLLKRLSIRCGTDINNVLIATAEIIKQSSLLLVSVLKSLTHPYSPHPHESIQHVIQLIKENRPMDRLPDDLPIMCDVIDLLDPELDLVLDSVGNGGDIGNLLSLHVMQRSIHQTTQESEHRFIQTLLQLPQTKREEDSTLILNYMWACLHNPRLWQGKVKSRNYDLGLELSIPQLTSISEHLIKDDSFMNISLLTRSCDIIKMKELTKHLTSLPSSEKLLIQLYHSVPGIVDLIPANLVRPHSVLSIPSKIDNPIHYIIHTMIGTSNDRGGGAKLKELNSASNLCRHIALRHPLLTMRHLSLIGTLLKGKLSVGHRHVHKSNLYLIFNNCFHILELTQPMLFNSGMPFEDLCTVLDPFMEFLKLEGVESALFLKVMTLLQQYCQHNRTDAIKYIERHKDTLSSLADLFYKHKAIINPLLSLLDSKQLFVSLSAITDGGKSGHSYEKVLPFLSKLKHSDTEEGVLEVLEDLDDSSTRSVEILEYFILEVCRIVQSGGYSHSVLKLCHELLVRYLRHSPQALDKVLPHIINCLTSHDRTVVLATIPTIPEIIALSSGSNAERLLMILFDISITYSEDYVTQSISTLIGHMTV